MLNFVMLIQMVLLCVLKLKIFMKILKRWCRKKIWYTKLWSRKHLPIVKNTVIGLMINELGGEWNDLLVSGEKCDHIKKVIEN